MTSSEIDGTTIVRHHLTKSSSFVFYTAEEGHCVERKHSRKQILEYSGRFWPDTPVAMEACSLANWWSRKLRELGRDARLIPALFRKPYEKVPISVALDAKAICETRLSDHDEIWASLQLSGPRRCLLRIACVASR